MIKKFIRTNKTIKEDRVMKKCRILVLALLIAALTAAVSFTPVVSANSAQMHWHGISSSGALILGEDCPVVVNSEKLVFDIPHFPKEYYSEDDADEIEEYDAKVSATYEFENPADYDVNVRLAFPFGAVPDYFGSEKYLKSKYSVTVDGEDVDKKVRYTYTNNRWSDGFITEEATVKLRDDKISSGWINGDVKVAKYTVKPSGASHENYTVCLEMNKRNDVKILGGFNYYSDKGDNIEYGNSVRNSISFSFCVVYAGDAPSFAYRAEYEGKEISCDIKEISITTRTLEEAAAESYPFEDESESAKIDWYNIIVDFLSENDGLISRDPFALPQYFVPDCVMYWYEYDLNIPAGAKVVNTVTAPLFPAIDRSFNPPVYNYNYLLSPAKDWADFGTLDIEVNTPYFILGAEEKGFEKTETGYKLSFDSLPDGELSFNVSESETPEKVPNSYLMMTMLIILSIVTPLLGIAGIASIIAVASVGARRRNSAEEDPEERKKNTQRAAGTGFVSAAALGLALVVPLLSVAMADGAGAVIAITAVFFALAAAIEAVAVKLLYVKKTCHNNNSEDETDNVKNNGESALNSDDSDS